MLSEQPNESPSSQPKRDLNEIFDLDRKKLTKQIVDRLEQAFRDIEAARDDMKEIVAECNEAGFKPRDVKAMKKIAQLRHKDKKADAAEQLEALNRIGGIVGFDLFAWAADKD